MTMAEHGASEFERAASRTRRQSFVGELLRFQLHTMKWWMLPILVIFLLVSLLGLLAGTGVAPFIYTIF
jgi:hypothetical protein